MAYTPDSCQDQFTPQQTARARCYLDRLINFVTVPDPSDTPISVPAVAGTTPVRVPSAQTVSVGYRTETVAVLLSFVALIVSL